MKFEQSTLWLLVIGVLAVCALAQENHDDELETDLKTNVIGADVATSLKNSLKDVAKNNEIIRRHLVKRENGDERERLRKLQEQKRLDDQRREREAAQALENYNRRIREEQRLRVNRLADNLMRNQQQTHGQQGHRSNSKPGASRQG